jgi:hypothetical protein
MAFISQPSVLFPLLTYQTLRNWGIEKSRSYEKLRNGVEDDGSARGLFNGKEEMGDKKWAQKMRLR